jgi:hypothetical protein
MFAERSHIGACVIVYAVFVIERVHAVDADQQDVLAAEGMVSRIVASLIIVARVRCGNSERRDRKD